MEEVGRYVRFSLGCSKEVATVEMNVKSRRLGFNDFEKKGCDEWRGRRRRGCLHVLELGSSLLKKEVFPILRSQSMIFFEFGWVVPRFLRTKENLSPNAKPLNYQDHSIEFETLVEILALHFLEHLCVFRLNLNWGATGVGLFFPILYHCYCTPTIVLPVVRLLSPSEVGCPPVYLYLSELLSASPPAPLLNGYTLG